MCRLSFFVFKVITLTLKVDSCLDKFRIYVFGWIWHVFEFIFNWICMY